MLSNKILRYLTSKCAVLFCIVLVLSGSVETQLQLSCKFCKSSHLL